MADNTTITPGTGVTVAADDIGGVLYQRVKIAVGADGSAADLAPGGATAANSLPVTLSSDGTFATLSGALTETAPASDTASSGINGRLQRIAQRLTSLITALGSPFQAGGSIGNTAFGATQSGTWTVQPGNTANTTAWKVDGSAVTQPTVGNVASGATDSGNPVKVGGKYNATPPTFTDGQRADIQMDAQGGQKVSGTWFKPTVATVSALNGDILAAFDATGYQSGALQLTGTWSGTVQLQTTLDGGTVWNPVCASSISGGTVGNVFASNGMHVFAIPPGAQIRLRAVVYTSGTIIGNVGLSAQPVSSLSLAVNGTTVLVNAGGSVASGAADSGNPVKIGGKYNATLPTFTDGNRADTQSDINGFTRVAAAPTLIKTATPTVSTTPAYTSGDSIGGLISLTSAVRYAAGGGTITSVVISDKAKQSAAIDVVFFTANPGSTTFTDNAALAVNAADLISIVGVISVTSWSAFSANSVGSALGQSLPFVLASGTTLYAALVARGTPTYASTSDIQLTVGIIPN